MRNLTRMAMMRNGQNGSGQPAYNRYAPSGNYEAGMNGNSPSYGGYKRYSDGRFAPHNGGTEIEIENRFRDRRGREHYNNGRYAPMRSEYGNGSVENRYEGEPENRLPPAYESSMDYRYNGPKYRQDDGESRMIGFYGGEMGGGYRMDATHHPKDELSHYRSQKQSGHASSRNMPMEKHQAQEWVKSMKHSDGSSGEHWTFDQTHQVMKQRNIDCDPAEFYATMNMLWSDYGSVAKKYGVDNVDFWSEMSKSFLKDKDAMDNKLMLYYECVVEK